MSFLYPRQVEELARFAGTADKEARSDLVGGFIRNENDYTSNFTGALRRIINSNSLTGLTATSFLLSTSDERATGCDAAIIITDGCESKVSIFEAKWPRFSQPHYTWDYLQTASGISHFSDQINRQKRFDGRFAVFEMFYCEYPFGAQPSFMQDDKSSCVWHDDIDLFKNNRVDPDQIWSQEELKTVLQKHHLDIISVVTAFAVCDRGKPIGLSPKQIASEFMLPSQTLAISNGRFNK